MNQKSLGRAASATLLLLLGACRFGGESGSVDTAQARLAAGDANGAILELRSVLQSDAGAAPARRLLGLALMDIGQPSEAEIEFRKALELKMPPEQVVPLIALAMNQMQRHKQMFEQYGATRLTDPAAQNDLDATLAVAAARLGQQDQARRLAEGVLARNPRHASAMLVLARQEASQKRIDEALALADKALEQDPRSQDGMLTRAHILLYGKHDNDAAVAAFRKLLTLNPNQVEAHSSLVSLALIKPDPEAAAAAYAAMVKAIPTHPQTRLAEVQLAVFSKQFPKARELLLRLMAVVSDNPQLLSMAGHVDLELNAIPSAIGHFQKASYLAPESAPLRTGLAKAYLRGGQPERALKALEPNLARNPNDAATLAMMGDAELQLGRPAQAEAMYLRALKAKPGDATLRTSLAMTRLNQGQVAAATNELQQLASTEKDTVADLALISAMLRQRNIDGALKAIASLEAKLPGSPQPEALRGQLMLGQGDIVKSRAHFDASLRLQAGYMPALQGLAVIDQREGKSAQAEARFAAALQADPQNLGVLMALVDLKMRKGGAQTEASALLDGAVKANPSDPAPRLAQIRLLAARRDFKGALNTAQAAATALPGNAEVQDALGNMQLLSGDTNQAILTYNKLAARDARATRPHMQLAAAYIQRQELTAAERAYRRALELEPDSMEAQKGLIALGVRGKNPAAALAAARAIQRQRPDVGIGYLLEGDVQAQFNNLDAAIAAYRAGLAKGNFVGLSERLYKALSLSKGKDEARRFADDWLQKHPEDAGLPFYLGSAAFAASDLPTAERYFAASHKANPRLGGALNNLAWVRAKLGRPDAVSLAEQAMAQAPDSPEVLDTMVFALVQAKQGPKAVEVLKAAMGRQAPSAGFQFSLAKLYADIGDTANARVELDKLSSSYPEYAAKANVAALRDKLPR